MRAVALACGLFLLLASAAGSATGAPAAAKARPTKHHPVKHHHRARQAVREIGAADAADDDAPGLHGTASFYGGRFGGRSTATGETFDLRQFTGASNRFALGSVVAVQRIDNGRCAIVRINDRMRAGRHRRRIIDVSRGVAEYLGMLRAGVVMVRVARLRDELRDAGPDACARAFEAPQPCAACGQPENPDEIGKSPVD